MKYKNKQIAEIEEKISRNKREYAAEKQATLDKEELSTTGKQKRIEELREEFYPRHQNYRAELDKKTSAIHSDLKDRLFATGSGSDADKLAIDQAVMNFMDTDNLTKKVNQAGSTVTLRAIGKAAYMKNDTNAIQAIYESSDELKEPLGDLDNFEQSYVFDKMPSDKKLARNMELSPPERPGSKV